MTTFLLIRHATACIAENVIAGRATGVHLSDSGVRQGGELADRLSVLPISAVYSSPLERAIETARPIARTRHLTLHISPALNEMDYGNWTGASLESLANDFLWRAFNSARSATRIPCGEAISEVQTRIVAELGRLAAAHAHGMVTVVTHAEVIRTALSYYLGISNNLFGELQISHASVSMLQFTAGIGRVLRVNQTSDAPIIVDE
ncbi:MAG: histidine phosphatase family protein [Candidatus Binataceae bacterium]